MLNAEDEGLVRITCKACGFVNTVKMGAIKSACVKCDEPISVSKEGEPAAENREPERS